MGEKPILFNYDEDKKKELAILAKREGRTLKEILTEIADEYLKVHKDGNPQHLMTNFVENEDFTGFPSMGVSYDMKKKYIKKHLSKDNRMNDLGKELWGHVLQWEKELRKL